MTGRRKSGFGRVLVVTAVAAIVLAACGGGGGSKKASTGSTSLFSGAIPTPRLWYSKNEAGATALSLARSSLRILGSALPNSDVHHGRSNFLDCGSYGA